MFFEGWDAIWRIFISCIVVYSALIFWLLISGKRTLSKWNSFDFVVTIALGSVLASAVLSKSTPILEGIFALFLLIAFQFVMTWVSVRVNWFKNLIKAKPTLLYDGDSFLLDNMKKQRVTQSEILAAVRAASVGSLGEIEAVVLETDGSFSVIKKMKDNSSRSALEDVEGARAV